MLSNSLTNFQISELYVQLFRILLDFVLLKRLCSPGFHKYFNKTVIGIESVFHILIKEYFMTFLIDKVVFSQRSTVRFLSNHLEHNLTKLGQRFHFFWKSLFSFIFAIVSHLNFKSSYLSEPSVRLYGQM